MVFCSAALPIHMLLGSKKYLRVDNPFKKLSGPNIRRFKTQVRN